MVRQETLGTVTGDWRYEGFESALGLMQFWGKLTPGRGYRPDDVLWVHYFERMVDTDRLKEG